MTITIRTAVEDDLTALAALHVAVWEHSYRGILPDAAIDCHTEASRRTNFEHVLTHSPMALLVAVNEDGILLGFCHADRVADDETKAVAVGEVRALYVAPGHKRQGLGTQLLDAALHRLRSRGCASVVIWTLVALNGACRFYERGGGVRSESREETFVGEPFTGIAYQFDLNDENEASDEFNQAGP